MTDREMLELAAKAEGSSDCFLHWVAARYPGREGILCRNMYVWNPLADDGDALRLAMRLFLSISSGLNALGKMVVCVRLPESSDTIIEELGDDPCAATRRAIVIAAAEIGKAMGK